MTDTQHLRQPRRALPHWLAASAAAVLLAACGGGKNDTSSATASSTNATALGASRGVADGGGTKAALDRPATRAEAARFLTAATFGPNDFEIELLMKIGYSAWIDRQFSLPATSHRAFWEARNAEILLATPTQGAGQDQTWESFWIQALNGSDQLRLRVAFALSEIFVISAVDGNVGNEPRALAAWLDMLGDKGLTTYRELLENVSLHPLMGLYLTSLHNQKADNASGRVPDENYAREVMQLFSVGVIKLNPDGTPLLVNNQQVETYTPADISGLARVFTGWSWACPLVNSNCFYNGISGSSTDLDKAFKPMMAYPQYHSTEVKTFLGVTIPVQTTANPAASLKVALDTLNLHANTAPFLSKQLIQRLVTSNPSPAYVQAVAGVFIDNGAGVRGDLKAVVKAILTHPEAAAVGDTVGKMREPMLRLSAFMRAFPYTSDTGDWKVGNTDSASTSLSQTPLRAGSVFNFYRPGYALPGGLTAGAGLVTPEMQLHNETSAAGWVNFMRDNLSSGVGQFNGTVNNVVLNRRDMQRDWSLEMALAPRSVELATYVTERLLYGQQVDALRTEITNAVNTITIPATNQTAIDAAKRNRINAAVLLTLASPEFLTQK